MTKRPLAVVEMDDSADDFEALYAAHAPLIYRSLFWRTQDEALAEDLTSRTFEKAWQGRARFDGKAPKAWLYRIARNTLIDHWRGHKDLPLGEDEVDQLVSDQATPAEVLDQAEVVADLRRAVRRLPGDMQDVVRLRFIERRSVRQTAVALGLTESNVRVIQYRALRKLRSYLS